MVLALVTVLAAAALVAERPSTQTKADGVAVTDPIFGPVPSSENGPDRLYPRLRLEQRDPMWAPHAEMELRNYFDQIRYGGQNSRLRIRCGSSLCEVVGTIHASVSKEDESNIKSPVNRAMQELQGKDIRDRTARFGLAYISSMFGG